MFVAYLVALGAMLFSGATALTLIYTLGHLDKPEGQASAQHAGV